jgi:galactose mutarotase-like enzyme
MSAAGPEVAMQSGYRVELTRLAGLRAWRLSDNTADLHTTWVPGAGMLGASLVHRGQEMLWQGSGVRAYAEQRKFMGIPFLHPWANRLDDFSYRAGGHDVVLDPASPLLLLDDNGLPIHGVLIASRGWRVREVSTDEGRARLSASLEFNGSDLLASFPFPHRVQLDIELSGGALRVCATLINLGTEPLPVAFGFHPYLRIPGAPRRQWVVAFPVRHRLMLDEREIPTGAIERVDPLAGPVDDRTWDDAFERVEPDSCFELSAGGRTIKVHYGDGFSVAQIFAPPGQEYLCVEPMTAPPNALRGPDSELGWVPVGEQRSATFRIACRIDPQVQE